MTNCEAMTVEHSATVSTTRIFSDSATPTSTPTEYAAITSSDAASHGANGSPWTTGRADLRVTAPPSACGWRALPRDWS